MLLLPAPALSGKTMLSPLTSASFTYKDTVKLPVATEPSAKKLIKYVPSSVTFISPSLTLIVVVGLAVVKPSGIMLAGAIVEAIALA
jgi:hypothetical protein